MAQLTPNYGLSMPDANDDYLDFRESYNDNMEIIDNNLGGGGGSGSANQNIAENYDDTLTYSVGDYVIYNGLLYKCDTAVATAETFDPTKWTHVVVTDEMGSGGGSGGHTIVDENGSTMPTESALQFTGNVSVSDDNVNGRTVVDILGGGGNIYGAFVDTSHIIKAYSTFTSSMSYLAVEDCFVEFYIVNTENNTTRIQINGASVQEWWRSSVMPDTALIPVKKGQTISVATAHSSYDSSYTVYGVTQGTNGIFAPVIYSDTERKIGIWRDNKPLYQKTVHIGALIQDSSWHGVAHGVANLDKCISIEAICIATNGTEFYPINLYRPTTNTGVMVYATASDVYYMNNYYSEMEDAYFTIQYTKSSDVAGSGNWNTDGVPTVHYSTNEQVIGTWIDGKPIYEIVIPTVYTGSNFWDYPVATIPNYANITIRRIEGYNNVGKGGTSAMVSMNYSHTDSNRWSNYFWVNDSTGEIMIGAGQSETVTNPLFIIQYTKTTD